MSDWKLLDSNGELFDDSVDILNRLESNIWQLLGSRLMNIEFHPNEALPSLIITFSNKMALILITNDDGYEDWSIVCKTCSVFGNGSLAGEVVTVFSKQ